jgi:hypothetical protein
MQRDCGLNRKLKEVGVPGYCSIIVFTMTAALSGLPPTGPAQAQNGCKKLVVTDSTASTLKSLAEGASVFGFVIAVNPKWSTTARIITGVGAAAGSADLLNRYYGSGDTVDLCPVTDGGITLFAMGDQQSIQKLQERLDSARGGVDAARPPPQPPASLGSLSVQPNQKPSVADLASQVFFQLTLGIIPFRCAYVELCLCL